MTMRQTVLLFLALTIAATASAGVTYQFESTSSGLASQTISGIVKADQGKVRIDVASGDGILLQDGSVILGGQSAAITVMNPAKKTYFEIDPGNLFGASGGVMSQLQGLVNIDARNPQVAMKDGGEGGKLEGYDTHRWIVESSFDMVMDMLGQRMTSTIRTRSEYWTTNQIPAAYANIFQTSSLRTGLPAIDKVLNTVHLDGFPLKQVTRTTISMNGSDQVSTSTTRVTNLRKAEVPAAAFVLPPGYTKVDSPLESMLKNVGK